MFILDKQQLRQFLPQLERDLPRSLPVFHLVRNVVRERFAWPGLEFVVDDFPNVSVCICRPEPSGENYVPIMNGYVVFVYSTNTSILKQMLYEQRVVDWTKPIMFADITEPEHLVLLEDGKHLPDGRFDQLVYRKGQPEGAIAYHFDLPNLDLSYEVPKGYRMGTLQPHHAAIISRDRKYGHEANNTIYFRYLIENGFPTAALFPDDEPDNPVAYVLYKGEGVIGAAFVKPQLRNAGIVRAVGHAVMQKLRDMGEDWLWGDVMKFNLASQQAVEAGGGKRIPGMDIHWIGYLPNSEQGDIKVEYYV
ncbi:uncharacterized protein LOC129594717 [Paramacrobiotus metropolitanus]|uniref:uncharacterized protein LOC129594717 n=1 Tax=Paramacrobiotus metropolitanus TaxID=2943436 RepID=UPI0024462111|nr:uncharacterized protein LOC129594717 [Paramacrobiotus metropolitanus]